MTLKERIINKWLKSPCYKNEDLALMNIAISETLKEVKRILIEFKRGDRQIHEDFDDIIKELEKIRRK